jgi:hypothetical protein
MAGKVTFIKPLANNSATGNNNASEYPQQHGAAIMGAGNVNSNQYGWQPVQTQNAALAPLGNPASAKNRVDVAATGDMGIITLFGGAKVDQMQPGQYIMQGSMTRLAGSGNSLLNSPQKLSQNGRNANNWHGDEETGIQSWDYASGKVTLNGRQGHWFGGVNPIGGASGVLEPTPTIFAAPSGIPSDAVPGTLVYMVDGQVPIKSQYGPRYDN